MTERDKLELVRLSDLRVAIRETFDVVRLTNEERHAIRQAAELFLEATRPGISASPDFQPATTAREQLLAIERLARKIAAAALDLSLSGREIDPGSHAAEVISQMPGNLRAGLEELLRC